MPNSNPFYEAQVVRRKPHALWSFAIAVLSVAVSTDRFTGALIPFTKCSCVAVSLRCDGERLGWGIVTGVARDPPLLSLFQLLLFGSVSSFFVNADEMPRGVLFLLSALFVALLTSAQRRATESLMHARDDLSEPFTNSRKLTTHCRRRATSVSMRRKNCRRARHT